ncbi:glycerophosphodiester phosphodiesterase [Pseudoduganella sp. GCM10020061]|uniref:glycerophosphodiester phosphodiesterase n=1 Tax=Pseudoduganella sp. GCM10020061 TaxID=3317345 RepID=UPI00363676E5
MWPYPRVLAHRGGGKLAPENTMAGFASGFALGFAGVEFDVMLARDKVPVVMHDPYLGRTVNGAGHVYDYDAHELARMDAGSWFSRAYAGERVPLFDEVVSFCRRHAIWMNIEIKPAPGHEEETGRVVAETTRSVFAEEIAQRGAGAIPLFSSFSETALDAAMVAAPDIPRAILFKAVPPDWELVADRIGAVAIHCNHNYLTPEAAQAIKAAGYGLLCYTVNNPARARLLAGWGVDALCTDRLDLIPPAFLTA